MKWINVIIVIFLKVCILTMCYSQKLYTYDSFNGIGKFKILASSVDVISEIEQELKTKRIIVEDCSKPEFLMKNEKIYEMRYDTNGVIFSSQSLFELLYCNNVKIFYLPKYVVSGVTLDELYLVYFNDTLIELSVDAGSSLEFIDAIKLKYGSGQQSHLEVEIECGYELLGYNVTKSQQIFISRWHVEDSDLESSYYLSEDYNISDCEHSAYASFRLKSKSMMDNALACAKKSQEETEKELLKNKLKSLDGF